MIYNLAQICINKLQPYIEIVLSSCSMTNNCQITKIWEKPTESENVFTFSYNSVNIFNVSSI